MFENNIIENKKVNEIKLIDSLKTIDIKYNYNKSLNVSEIFLNGENVEKKIRNKKVSNYVSKVSQIIKLEVN